jgi:Na+-transporting methylmalonyl-CoA/oxaloacetate decarboxylase gamma subunit
MYLFTDQAVAFRRVVFASMLFWFTVLATAFLFLERLKGMYHYVMQLGFVVVVLSLLAGVAAIMDMSTQQVAAREWFAATCASRIAPLSEPARVSRTEALKAIALPFPQALSSDELQVRTIFYPSGAMLIWLSHLDAQRKAFSPWKLRFTDELSSSNWNLAFAKCAAEYKE